MKGAFLFLFLLVGLCAGAQVDGRDGAIVREMKGLVAGADFFRLERMLGQYSDSISTADRLYFQSYVDNGFNRNRASIYRIDSFTHLDIHERTDTAEAQLLQIAHGHRRLFLWCGSCDAGEHGAQGCEQGDAFHGGSGWTKDVAILPVRAHWQAVTV